MNTFNLVFKKSTTRLAGFPYGKEIYDSQVKNKIDFTNKITIIFPDNIEKIASSFTQGFFEEIVQKIGLLDFEKKVDVVAKDKVKASIYNDLF